MTQGPRNSTRDRRRCFDAHRKTDESGRIFLVCYFCGGKIDPARDRWDAAHLVRRSAGGSDEPENVKPAHEGCHAERTPDDVRENSKGKRVSERHFGIKRSRGFYRPNGVKFDWSTGRYRRD